MTGAVGMAVATYATHWIAGWLIWSTMRGDRCLDVGGFARALLIGPAAITAQMLLYGAVGIPYHILGVLAPWWCVFVWQLRRELPRITIRRQPWSVSLGVVIAAQTAVILLVGTSTPVNISDSVHNFALPAKALALHGGFSISAFDTLVDPGNVHYPPLLMCNEALFFLIDADAGAWLLQPMFALGWLAWAILVTEALWRADRPGWSFCIALVVVATPEPVSNAIHGLADVRVMGALLLVLLEVRRFREQPDRSAVGLAVAAIAAGLTKREGYLIAAAVCGFLLLRGRGLGASRATVWTSSIMIGVIVAAWPIYARLSGLADLPAEFHPDVTLSVAAEALVHIPALLAGMVGSTVSNDVEHLSRWGLFWPAATAFALWQAFARRDRTARWMLLFWFVHALIAAHSLAVIAVGLRAETEWVLRATVERIMLVQMVWLVLASSARPASHHPS